MVDKTSLLFGNLSVSQISLIPTNFVKVPVRDQRSQEKIYL